MASNRLLVRESSDGNSHVKTAHTNQKVQALRHMAISRMHLLLCSVAGVSLSLASAISPSSAYGQVLPTGGIVMGGQANIGTAGNHLSIQQGTPTAIISWDQFSIGQPNSVHFDNGAGATLNRVRGNVASQIDGSLTATGSVYLVNPAGIAVGTTGRVETGGTFVGSTLDISDEDFARAARGEAHTFKGGSAATIVNAGRIGSLGGDVALIAQSVENSGDISALKGTAALAAGTEVYVQDRHVDGGRFVVKTGGAGTKVRNTGSIRAVEVELRANGGNVYALAGNRRGVISASGTSSRGGRVYLTAGSGGTVEVTQRVEARRVASDGSLSGGEIRVSAKTVRVDAVLDASGRTVLDTGFPAGGVEDDTGAIGGVGGLVLIEGNDITLERSSLIDVSGTLGGVALVGGDYQGGVNVANNYLSERVETAKNLTVAEGARITADASVGNGGKVVLWSDVQTDFAGKITAKSMSGIGGDAEVSGKALLAFNGGVDLTGSEGTGNLLLDPYNLTIVAGSGGSVNPTSDNSTLGADTLTNLLKTANTTVTTGSGGAQSGDITVNAALTWASANTLTLFAANTITINEAITAQNGGLTLKAKAGTVESPTITTGANGAIDVGVFYLETGAWVQNSANLPTFAAKDFRLAGGQAVDGRTSSLAVKFVRATGGTGAIPSDAYKISDVYGLQGMATYVDKHYALTNDIDASTTSYWYNGAGFSPIGYVDGTLLGGGFSGSFEGRGHVISGLTINRPSQDNVGLFGAVVFNPVGIVRHVGLEGGSITGRSTVGAVAGWSTGRISNVYATGSVTGVYGVGGLVGGIENSGRISSSYATGSVTGVSGVGGIVGDSFQSFISLSYATGIVKGEYYVGGLTGSFQDGAITDSYAHGAVTASGSGAGGLVGFLSSYNTSEAKITNSYATGAVTGPGTVGGLVGVITTSNAIITNSFWDKDTTGVEVGVGSGSGSTTSVTGITSSTGAYTAYAQSTYSGWNFSNTWYMAQGGANGVTRPFLRMELAEHGKTYDASGNVIANTYTIKNVNQLQLIKMYEGAGTAGNTYILANDIDMSIAKNNNQAGHWVTSNLPAEIYGRGFVPIGTTANPFQGTFNGADHVIDNFYIDRMKSVEVGLFGYTQNTTISNVGLKNATVNGGAYVGGLVGVMYGGSITSSYVEGEIGGYKDATKSGAYVGGLVGRTNAASSILYSYSTAAVSGVQYVGGLIGANNGTVNQSYATGAVKASSGTVGGLIGSLDSGTVSNVYATGDVTGKDYVGGLIGSNRSVGGLVGYNNYVLYNVNASGTVTGYGSYVGGLIGYNNSVGELFGDTTSLLYNVNVTGNGSYVGGLVGYNNAIIHDVTVAGTVTGYGNYIGGLAGYNIGTIEKSTSNVTLVGSGIAGYVGGLAGYSEGFIQESHATGSVTSGTGNYTGGFVGYNAGSIILSDTTGDVHSAGNFIGGFAGYNKKTIKSSEARNATVQGTGTVGGFVGHNEGTIEFSFATANVSGTDVLGGFAGYNKGTIKNSEARNATVQGTSTIGGFAGHNGGTIELSFATANVSGTDILGGLVGYNKGTVNKTYATGNVTGTADTIGGLIGDNHGQLRLSYATGAVSGKNTVGGLVGLNFSSISDSYSTGNVSATDDRVGGLIGALASGSVARTYARGSVTLTSENIRIGGLVGFYDSGTISSSLWNIDANKDANQARQGVGATTGKSTSGVMALTDADFKSTASFMSKAVGWNFNTVWAPPGDGYLPELYALSNVIRVHSLVGLNGVTYGDTTVSIDNSILSGISTIYGGGAYTGGAGINTKAAYDSLAAQFNFGTQADSSIEQLNTGRYTLSIGGTGKFDTDQGYRIIYTTGVTIAKKTITLDLASQKTYDGMAWTLDDFAPTYAPGSLAFGQTLADLGVLSLSGNGVGAVNAGKYSLSARFDSSGTAKNYDIKYSNPFLTIAKVKISAADIENLNGTIAVNKDYDGSDRFTLSSGATIAGIAGETLSLNMKDGKYDAVNVGNANVTGTWSISKVAGGQKNASNYELDDSSFAKIATITAATIDLSKQVFKVTKTYDGNDIFTIDTRQINTGIKNEVLTLSLINGKFDSPDAGDRIATGTWIISNPAKGNGIASNYIIKGGTEVASANVTIKQAVLDLSKITDLIFNADKIYDGSDSYTLTPVNFSTGINGETLTAALDNGKYSSADAGRRIVTGTWNVADSIGSTANYQIKGIHARQAAQIDKAKLSQAFIDNLSTTVNVDKVYDGKTKFDSTSVTGINTGINGETLTLRISNGKYDAVDVGAANVTGKWNIASVAGGQKRAANYELDYTTFSKTANITPAVIDLSRQTFRADKIYDGSDVFTLADRQIVTGIIGEQLTLSLLDGKYSSANAGNVTVGGTWQLSDEASGKSKAANYIIRTGTENAAVNATIKQATLNLRTIEALKFNANKIYDGSNVYTFAPAIINTGVNGEALNVSLLDGKYSSADAGGRFVTGTWDLANASGLLANYNVTGFDVRQLATISKADLTITAADATVAYTGKVWTGGAVGYSGFINGENEGVLGGQLRWKGSGNLQDIGTYIITPGGLSAKNYQLVYVSGVLTIQ